MDEELKKRIMQRYLAERSLEKGITVSEDALAAYAQLASLLDYIGTYHNNLFDFTTLETHQNQWKILVNILNHSCNFDEGSPPPLTSAENEKAAFALKHWHNSILTSKLPQDDYYSRQVSLPKSIDISLNLDIQTAKSQIHSLIEQTFNVKLPNSSYILKKIEDLQEEIKKYDDLPPSKAKYYAQHKKALEQHLVLFQDLNKINNLKPVSIPQESGTPVTYYELAEATKGVTEKVALISADQVRAQLHHLALRQNLTLADYITDRDQFKLSTQAMLKLPKHKEIVEVQREAMALNISRLLGLNTARSTSVSYKNQPALFIPFDPIKELSNYATGELFKPSLGFSNQTYSHYSTINPVGEGLQAECFINDFGNSLALFYLSSDTDAIGGYCQNKALTNDKELFIFDQVIMDTDKFKLDSRLSLIPCQTLVKHTRHGQGRNRTLIEDSSIDNKFASLTQLKDRQEQIIHYLNRTIKMHDKRKTEIDKLLQNKHIPKTERQLLEKEENDIEQLINDAQNIKIKVQQRINAIDEVLPKTKGNVSNNEVKQALILEKLLHNPVLFNKLGRPYRNPWTYRQDKNITRIEALNDNNDNMLLTFNHAIPTKMRDYLNGSCGINSLNSPSATTLIISRAQLNALTEGMLHPERHMSLDMNAQYLDLSLITDAYTKGVNKGMITLIAEYQKVMSTPSSTVSEKLECINKSVKGLQQLIAAEGDKGFGMHLLSKLHFDIQQQLCDFIPQHHIELDKAFSAAIKLDRVAEFNQVVTEAIATKRENNNQFLNFLDRCLDYEREAKNHQSALSESQALHVDAQKVIHDLNQPLSLLMQLEIQPQANDNLSHVNPMELMGGMLDEQYEMLTQPNVPPSPDEDATINVDDVEVNSPPNRQGITIQTM